MSIRQNIRELRRQQGLTQEQVAQRLGVSAPAVNKWEKGVSCPDIALLPALARLLKTDVNALLDFEEELTRQEVAEFVNQLATQGMQVGVEEAFQSAWEKIRQYPNCHALLVNTAMVLDGVLAMNANKGSPDHSADIEAWYVRAAQSEDVQIRNQANSRLALRYMERREYDKAQALLDSLPPEPFFDKRQMQAGLYVRQERWEDAAKLTESGLIGDAARIQTALMTLISIAQKEGREQDARRIADIAVEVSRLLNQSEFTVQTLCYQQALTNKDADALMEVLQTLLPGLLKPWQDKPSPLYRHLPQKELGADFGKTMLASIVKDMEDEHIHEFDFVKADPRFKALMAEYKAKLEK